MPYSRRAMGKRLREATSGLAILVVIQGCTSLLGVDEFDEQTGGTDAGVEAGGKSTGGNAGSLGGLGGIMNTGGTAALGGAGTGPGENCLNGKDDDSDGDVDCADSDCSAAGYSCVAAPPANWQGPFAYWVGAKPHAPCPLSFPTSAIDGYDDLAGASAPANCACTCTKGGESCEAQVSHWQGASGCSGAASSSNWYGGTNCNVLGPGGFELAGFRSSTHCTPKTTKTVPPTNWKTAKRLCGGASLGTCKNAKDVCVGATQAPFHSQVCIARAGTHTCPSPYLAQHALYQSVADTRDCNCQCDVSHGSCTATVYAPLSVSGCTATSFQLSTKCSIASNYKVSINIKGAKVTAGASCTPKSDTSGSALPSGTVTVCCLNSGG